MTIAVVQLGKSATPSGNQLTASVTLNNCVAGNSLALAAVWWHTSNDKTISTITVSGTESNMTPKGAAPAESHATIGFGRFQFAVLDEIANSGNKTIELTLSAEAQYGIEITVFELSGADTAGIWGDWASATGNTETDGSYLRSLTTSVDNCMALGFGENSSGDDAAPESGWTAFACTNVNVFFNGQYKADVGTAGTVNVKFTCGASTTPFTAVAAWLKPAPAGGPDLVTYRPASDKSNTGGWTTSSGTGSLASHIDEATPDHADFIQSPASPTNAACEIYWETIATPSESSNHTFKYWLRAVGGGSMGCELELYANDGTLIDGWTVDPVPSSWTEYTRTLDATQMANWVAHGYGAASFLKPIAWTN